MANISIRNLDDSIKEVLRRRAAAEQCSMEEFLRRCLAAAAEEAGNPAALAGHEAAADWPGRLINEPNSEAAGAARAAAGETQPAGKGAEAPLAALRGKNIVLIIGGSIAAYKALELIRRLRRAGAVVRVIMTAAAQQFITPLAAGAVAGGPVYRHLFAREGEQDCAADWGGSGPGKAGGAAPFMAAAGGRAVPEIGHIQLARQADIVLVSAATASRLAKMAAGQADDLAGAVLLATHAPLVLAPAMNPAMWAHKATQRNVALLRRDGCHIIGPEQGEMAESGESGLGRMSEPAAIIAALAALAANLPGSGNNRQYRPGSGGGDYAGSAAAAAAASAARPGAAGPEHKAACRAAGLPAPLSGAYAAVLADPALPAATALAGRHIIVTSGPTHEALDPVRYLANRSSGRQGHALAAALAAAGARVTLISGPVALPDPPGAAVVPVTGAEEMRAAVLAALPADAAICVAAVADWRPQYVFSDKIKKPKIRVIAAGSGSGGQNKGEAAAKGLVISAGRATLALVENPDILAEIGHNAQRPRLVVGFAAETQDLLENAAAKLAKKGADWIIANNVTTAADGSSIMGGERNHIHILSRLGVEDWPEMSKMQVAVRLAAKIAAFFAAPAAE